MSFDVWSAILTAALGVATAGVSSLVAWKTHRQDLRQLEQFSAVSKELRRQRPRTTESLDAKIAKARALSDEAARLNAEVKSEFDLQFAAAKKAKADAETARREANDAEAVKKEYDAAIEAARGVISTELEGVVTKNAKADRRFQILVALASFLAGVTATTIVSLVLQAVAGG